MRSHMRNWIIAIGAAASLAMLAYARVVRPWGLRWGATDDDVSRVMPGDDWVPDPDYLTTKAIEIDAPASYVWPWLVQMGLGRGGLYSYDFLDRLFGFLDAPSAQSILPQFQHLEPGDVIPLGTGKPFPVVHVDPNRSLGLAGAENDVRWTWQFGLYETPDGGTRLVSRNRSSGKGTVARVMPVVIDPPAFIMTTQMLRNLKRRAEHLYRTRQAEPLHHANAAIGMPAG